MALSITITIGSDFKLLTQIRGILPQSPKMLIFSIDTETIRPQNSSR